MAGHEEEPPILDLMECSYCKRTFQPETLKKHATICKVTSSKPRKLFDSRKQRVEGTDLAPFNQVKQEHNKPQTYKSRHIESNLSTRLSKPIVLRSTDAVAKVPRIVGERTKPMKNCPNCERHFGLKAYDQHVTYCTQKGRLLPHTNRNTNEAQARLRKRLNYRAPGHSKPTNKDKYSNLHKNEKGPLSIGNSISFESKEQSTPTSCAKPEQHEEYDPFVIAERQLKELESEESTGGTLLHFQQTNNNKSSSYIDGAKEVKLVEKLITNCNTDEFDDNSQYNGIDPKLINDFDNLILPYDFNNKSTKSNDVVPPSAGFLNERQMELRKKREFPVDDLEYSLPSTKYNELESSLYFSVFANMDEAKMRLTIPTDDSAYSSLNRQHKNKVRSKAMPLQPLHPVYYHDTEPDPVYETLQCRTDCKPLARYCHECGKSYPTPRAKYCIYCGQERFVLYD